MSPTFYQSNNKVERCGGKITDEPSDEPKSRNRAISQWAINPRDSVIAGVLAWIKNIVLVLSETVLVLVIESRQS
jgi:hypothetical protein